MENVFRVTKVTFDGSHSYDTYQKFSTEYSISQKYYLGRKTNENLI